MGRSLSRLTWAARPRGQTNKDGKLMVPSAESACTDETGTAVVGQYTVIVSAIEKQLVEDALVTLLSGEDETKDAFTVLLSSSRLLDGNDRTVTTVLLPDTTPRQRGECGGIRRQ